MEFALFWGRRTPLHIVWSIHAGTEDSLFQMLENSVVEALSWLVGCLSHMVAAVT